MESTFDLEELEKDFIVDIMNCDKNKDYITAYIHNKDGSNNFSFSVTTSPDHLFYYGDVGTFVFHRFGQDKMLNFFNSKPNYPYWKEKLESGNVEKFDGDEILKSLLENVVDILDFSEVDFSEDDINNINVDKMLNILNELPEEKFDEYTNLHKSDFIYCFNEIVNNAYDEYCLGYTIENWTNIFDDAEGMSYKSYTDRFDLCCQNLSKYSGIILEEADKYLKGDKDE